MPYTFGIILTDESIGGVQRIADASEQKVIEEYRAQYATCMMGRTPHGLHYIPFPNQTESVAVWFAPVSL